MIHVLIIGTVLEVIRDAFPSGDPYWKVRLLTGKSEVGEVRLTPTRFEGTVPVEGDVIEVEATVTAYVTRRNTAGLQVTGNVVRDHLASV